MSREARSLLAEENFESFTGMSNDVTIEMEGVSRGMSDRPESMVNPAFNADADNRVLVGDLIGPTEDIKPIREPICVNKILYAVESRSSGSRPEHFDIGVRVIEARQLPGLDINPVVRLSVGDRKKVTTVQKSTNSPFWDQYFVFSFNQPRIETFQKVITAIVVDSKGVLKTDETIGSFSCDIGTVFSQPGHSFHRKWAVITDLESNEPRGYLKLDITVIFKGDSGNGNGSSSDQDLFDSEDRPEEQDDKNDDDIEGNLLLPVGVTERQSIKLVVKVYRAYGLTRGETGVKKALNLLGSSSAKENLNPYVVVSFAGHQAKTSIIKKTSSPIWNQQVTFVEMFPTFFQNIKFEVKDEEIGSDALVATYYLPLNSISSDGQDGYLPTFGPTFINLYGAARECSDSDAKTLASGLEEGVAYVGRLLVAITTEFVDLVSPDLERVSVQNIGPFDETILGPKKEFALFGMLNSVSRIDNRFADKSIVLELNMGDPDDLDGDGKVDEADKKARAKYRGVTLPLKPARCHTNSKKENSFYLPLETIKPIMSHRFSWIDDTWRLFVANRLSKIANNLGTGLADVDALSVSREKDAAGRLAGVLDQLIEDCTSFLRYLQGLENPPGIGRLDREKMTLQRNRTAFIIEEATAFRRLLSVSTTIQIAQAASRWVQEMTDLASVLHITFPDIFLSMIAGDKRVAQVRLPTRDIVFSVDSESRGQFCSEFRALLLRSAGRSSGSIKCQVQVYCWFGPAELINHIKANFRSGYNPDPLLESLGQPEVDPPTHLKYQERQLFQSRVHLYQARSLLGSDTSGLSDPYVKIYYDRCILVSHVEEKTLNPIWDELLIGAQVSLVGSREDIKKSTLTALVEIYDRDIVGDDELIGRTLVTFNTIRFTDETYSPPQLVWYDVWMNGQESGQILMACELIQIAETDNSEEYPRAIPGQIRIVNRSEVISIPPQIRPTLSKFKLQVIFWGVRDLKRVRLLSVDRPRADIECGGQILSSAVIPNYTKNPNFPSFRKEMDLMLPDQEAYCPPLSIRVGDCRAFGRFTLVGSHLVRSLGRFVFNKDKHVDFNYLPKRHIIINLDHLLPKVDESHGTLVAAVDDANGQRRMSTTSTSSRPKRRPDDEIVQIEKATKSEQDEEIDWWVRYSLSKNGSSANKRRMSKVPVIPYHTLFRVFPEELEKRYNGNGQDHKLTSFPLKRGKFENDANELKYSGIFKGAFRLYRYPCRNSDNLLDHLINNEPVKVLVRVYLVRAYDVIPRDANGKADLYPIIKLGKQKLDDVDKFIPNCLDPIFGRFYEFEATFPQDSKLTIALKDRDAFSKDELIGGTIIDLEDRFYSDHRFTCGLPRAYLTTGPGKWRDSLKPTQILTKMCRDMKMSHLIISKKYIQIGKLMFTRKNVEADIEHEEEQLALGVLNSWKEAFGYNLVPEHVETRSLYRSDKPGVKQGKLEMWVDLFKLSEPRPSPIDISPRAPRTYELRVIVWNTKDVILDDDSIVSGEKMSDIYVKGWLAGPKSSQQTDVHFRSVTGEGNFNWRFVFRFDLLPAEGLIVVRRKENFFSINQTELKLPCRLNLQVWDYDSFSGDDFLGCLPLDLMAFPRGARNAKECELDVLAEPEPDEIITKKRVNLFKEKRLRGWWPFYARLSDGSTELTGKLEADFELLTKEEAEACPAGQGWEAPQPLDKPIRPETSFLWFANPWKSFKYIIWSRRKWTILKFFVLIFLFLFLLLFVYSLPGYTVKKIIGA